MANLYLSDTYKTEGRIKVVKTYSIENTRLAFSLVDNIGRPAGGGQPADNCSFAHNGTLYDVECIYKQKEKPFQTLYEYHPYDHPPLQPGDEIDFLVNSERRINLSRCHTLTHVIMAAIRRSIPGYASRGAEILDDERNCRLWFTSSEAVTPSQLTEVDKLARSVVTRGLSVTVVIEPSLEAAEAKYGAWRVDTTLGLKGKIRVILIGQNWDANPCSGTHISNTQEISAFAIGKIIWNSQRNCWELPVERTDSWRSWHHD